MKLSCTSLPNLVVIAATYSPHSTTTPDTLPLMKPWCHYRARLSIWIVAILTFIPSGVSSISKNCLHLNNHPCNPCHSTLEIANLGWISSDCHSTWSSSKLFKFSSRFLSSWFWSPWLDQFTLHRSVINKSLIPIDTDVPNFCNM